RTQPPALTAAETGREGSGGDAKGRRRTSWNSVGASGGGPADGVGATAAVEGPPGIGPDELCPWFTCCCREVGPTRFSPAFLYCHGYHDRQYDLEQGRWVPAEVQPLVADRRSGQRRLPAPSVQGSPSSP